MEREREKKKEDKWFTTTMFMIRRNDDVQSLSYIVSGWNAIKKKREREENKIPLSREKKKGG